jgi:hypothetical protein
MAFLGYTIYKQVSGQVFPYDRFPFVVLGWLALSLVIVITAPGLAKRLGEGLARREGMSAEGAEADAKPAVT